MAQLPGEARRSQYTATAGQTVFIYDFLVYEDDELTVQSDTDTLTLTTDYTVQDAGEDAGGTITLVTGATAGDVITITGNTMVERETTFTTGGDFLASAINAEYDRLDNITKEIISSQADNFKLAVYDADVSKTIPTSSTRKALVWNTAATALENSTYDPDAQVILAAAQVVLAEAQVTLAEAEVVKCQDEVDLCEAETALCEAETALCEAETALCVAETAKCVAETAKCVTQTGLAEGYASDASDSADDAAASAASIGFDAVAEDIVPDADSTRDLGTTSKRWAEVYGDAGVFTDTLTVGGDAVLTSAASPNSAFFRYVTDAAGGTYTTGSAMTRPIDSTAVYNDITGVSVASNQITLPVGVFDVEYMFVSAMVGQCYGTFYDVTNTAAIQNSIAVHVAGDDNGKTNSDKVRVTVTGSATVYDIRMTAAATRATDGMGVDNGAGNVYLTCKITEVV